MTNTKNFCFAMFNVNTVLNYIKRNYSIRINTADNKIMYKKANDPNSKYVHMDDIALNSIKVELDLANITCSKDSLKTLIYSNQFEQYDPYIEWLDSLPLWDGHDYIKDLADKVETDDQEWWEYCLRKWLVAFVASLADEDSINSQVLIIIGKQGCGKSSFFKNLMPKALKKYYSAGTLDLTSRDSQVLISELAMFNLDEMCNMTKREVDSLKEFITKNSIYLRRYYTQFNKRYIRRCSFCGTSNHSEILHDSTGSRRFLCHMANKIEYKLEVINFDQLFAQCYQLFKEGFQFYFDDEENKMIEIKNMRFKATSVEEEAISSNFAPCKANDPEAVRYKATEILVILQNLYKGTRMTKENIGKILSTKGYECKTVNGIKKWIVKPITNPN